MNDPKRLRELRILMGKDYVLLLRQVLQDMEEPHAHLRKAVSRREGVIAALHALRGVASNVGCDDLNTLCIQAEKALHGGIFPAACLAAIDAAIRRCRSLLESEVAAVAGR